MNWYEKHLGDWAKKTGHLSMVEEGAYNRLCDWCYSHERPLPLPEREVCKIARANNPQERAATLRVLHEFFTLAEDGWHQGRIDKLLAVYTNRVRRDTNNPASPAQRAQRYRDKRAELFKRLHAVGLSADFNTPNKAIEALLAEHEPNGQSSRVVTRDVTENVTVNATASQPPTTNRERDGVTAATSADVSAAAALAPDFALVARQTAEANGIADPTETGRIGRLFKAAAFQSFNLADPRFLALMRAGVTDDEWRLTAAEAVARGKGWGWLLATLQGRRDDVAKGYVAIPNPRAAKRLDSVQALTPTAAGKAPPF